MTEPATERLRELLGKASGRPWIVLDDGYLSADPDRWADALLAWDHDGLGQSWRNEADAQLIVEAVNALPALLDAHDRMAAALRDAYEAMDAASKWAVHQGPERDRHGDVTPEAADRHIAGFDALLDAQVRAGQVLGILSGGAALAVPKEANPDG